MNLKNHNSPNKDVRDVNTAHDLYHQFTRLEDKEKNKLLSLMNPSFLRRKKMDDSHTFVESLFSKYKKQDIEDIAVTMGMNPETQELSEYLMTLSADEQESLNAKLSSVETVKDGLIERKVGNETLKVKELANSEEAKKFLEENKGYAAVDEENGKVYAALVTE